MSYTFSYGGPSLTIQDVYKYVMLTVLIVWGPINIGVKEKGQEMIFKGKKKKQQIDIWIGQIETTKVKFVVSSRK